MTFTNTQTKLGQAITTNASGDYAVRTIIEGDQTLENLTLTGDLNGGGGHILNDQTTTNMMSKGTVYRFDGVDDKIVATAQAMTYPFTMWVKFRYHAMGAPATIAAISNNGTTDQYFAINDRLGGGELTVARRNTTNINTDLAYTMVEGTEYDVIVNFINATSLQAYVNGVPLSAQTGLTSVAVPTFDELTIGVLRTSTPSQYEKMEINTVGLFNLSPSENEVKDLISGNIPFLYQYGSQTSLNLATLANSAGGTAYDTFDGASATAFHAITDGSAATIAGTTDAIAWVSGKKYRIKFTSSAITGTAPTFGPAKDVAATTLAGGVLTNIVAAGANVYEFTAGETATGTVCFQNTADASEFTISAFSITQVGAVALYDQSSISETFWYNKSSNSGLDGAVTGASVLNPPSVTPLLAMHSMTIRLQPGGTPGTNINVTDLSSAIDWNPPALTNATNLAKNATDGSFTLITAGTKLTINSPSNVVGVLSANVRIHDLNSSSVTEMYFAVPTLSSGVMSIALFKRGAAAGVDLTTILDAGDLCDINIAFVTAT